MALKAVNHSQHTMKKFAIIVAGGTGSRMKGDMPKQFMMLNGKPVIQYSIDAFHDYDESVHIILVIHPNYLDTWEKISDQYGINSVSAIVPGGNTRFGSVKNGLEKILDDGLVAVHDAARPVIDKQFIADLFSDAARFGSAIPGLELTDTVRMIDGDNTKQLDRTLLRAIQTPQVFRVSELKHAYQQPFQPVFTDDASVLQSAGYAVHLSNGKPGNIKITQAHDIALAEVLLRL